MIIKRKNFILYTNNRKRLEHEGQIQPREPRRMPV